MLQRILAGVVWCIVLVIAMMSTSCGPDDALAPTTGQTTSAKTVTTVVTSSGQFDLDLGPADRLTLTAVWQRVAARLGFDATTARAWDVIVGYSSSDSLVHLSLSAKTTDDKEVGVSSVGYGGEANRAVTALVTSKEAVGGPRASPITPPRRCLRRSTPSV